jgi:hypothetical protein
MFPKFFGIPQVSLRNGKIKGLGRTAAKVYMALCHESEYHSTRELARTVAQLQALVGGSPNSHAKARAELIRAGLVQAEPFGTEGFVFVLCDPETGAPWPLHPKERVLYKPKGATSAASPLDTATHVKPGKPPRIDSTGTSFSFGANAPELCGPCGKANEPNHEQAVQSLQWDEIAR